MKKRAITILTVLAAVSLIAGVAFAGPWSGYHHGYGTGGHPGPCYYGGSGPEHQAFLEETADLRSELAGKRGEYQALMSRENPDPQQAAQLQKEMSRIREQIRAKAQQFEASGNFRGYGYGNGGAWGHHRGGGRCW